MLIICNGAFKSGSSWLHAILVELAIVKKINIKKTPAKYTNDINSPTTIIESQLQEFIDAENFLVNNYLTKAHFFKQSTLEKSYFDNVKFLFIERDIRDAIVSHYYHVNNKYRFDISFFLYYSLLGRYKAYEIGLFNNRCKQYMGEDNFFNYADLITNFSDTIKKVAKVIEIDNLSVRDIMRVKEQTSLVKLREGLKRGDLRYYPSKKNDNWKLFRKGEVGGWKKYFSGNQLTDIESISKGKFSRLSKIIYFFVFTLRRIVFKVE
tara:strand:- start:574 stop:1368 length:795 start_codon:yes stop_codon:yes gene_type:complete